VYRQINIKILYTYAIHPYEIKKMVKNTDNKRTIDKNRKLVLERASKY